MTAEVEQSLVRADPDPAAVADDLRRRVEGEVLFDSLHRTLYSTAACIYQVLPLGAVVPRHGPVAVGAQGADQRGRYAEDRDAVPLDQLPEPVRARVVGRPLGEH